MAIYATTDDLDAYVQDNPALVVEGDAERLLQRGERDVDRLLGPYPVRATGLKLDPAQLTTAQRAALSRAVCAACEFRAQLGEDALVGEDDALPEGFRVIRTAGRTSPKALEELAGSGLLTYSGCATPTDSTCSQGP